MESSPLRGRAFLCLAPSLFSSVRRRAALHHPPSTWGPFSRPRPGRGHQLRSACPEGAFFRPHPGASLTTGSPRKRMSRFSSASGAWKGSPLLVDDSGKGLYKNGFGAFSEGPEQGLSFFHEDAPGVLALQGARSPCRKPDGPAFPQWRGVSFLQDVLRRNICRT